MTSRRSFFAGFAKLAAIVALAPQIAFGVINKPIVQWFFRKYYQAKSGKWVLFHSPSDDFHVAPPEDAKIWLTQWEGYDSDERHVETLTAKMCMVQL